MNHIELYNDKRFKAIINIPGWAEKQMQGEGGLQELANAYSESVWANRCIAIRANLLASIPWCIHKIGEEETTPIEDHELVSVLDDMDGETNWEDAIRSLESDIDIYGTGYLLKLRAGTLLMGLRRLNPLTMSVKKSPEGIGGFEQTLEGSKVQFAREDILYFHEYHPVDDLGGLSMMRVALPAVLALTNTEKYLTAFFENYALPPVIVSTEQDMLDSDFEKLKAWWNKTFRGAKNQHKIGFLSKGLKPEPIGFNLSELALEQVRETCRRDICGVFGVPPSLAGAWESANYATALEERRSIYTETIIPRARYFASIINSYLVQEIDPSVEFSFMFEELEVMQPDKKAEAERLGQLVRDKIIKPEVAAVEMGYSEDDVPEAESNPIPPQLENFTGLPDDEIEKRKEQPEKEIARDEEPSLDEEQFKAELRSWKRKSLRKFKSAQKADVEFITNVIPDALQESIRVQLAAAESIEDISSIFDGARLFEGGHRKTMKAELMDEAKEDLMDRITLSPNITVNVEPTPVTVNVEPTPVNVKVSPTPVTVEPAVVNVPEPKVVVQRKGKTIRKVHRDPSTNKIDAIVEEDE